MDLIFYKPYSFYKVFPKGSLLANDIADVILKLERINGELTKYQLLLTVQGNHLRMLILAQKERKHPEEEEQDLDELKACIELGFGFDSPALGLYYAVNKTIISHSSVCESIPSPIGSPHSIVGPGDNPQTVKTRLRQWAQVVACSVRQSS
ncbi:hypothetical protein GQ457_09G010550 [Hibiscus cannabinus]